MVVCIQNTNVEERSNLKTRKFHCIGNVREQKSKSIKSAIKMKFIDFQANVCSKELIWQTHQILTIDRFCIASFFPRKKIWCGSWPLSSQPPKKPKSVVHFCRKSNWTLLKKTCRYFFITVETDNFPFAKNHSVELPCFRCLALNFDTRETSVVRWVRLLVHIQTQ